MARVVAGALATLLVVRLAIAGVVPDPGGAIVRRTVAASDPARDPDACGAAATVAGVVDARPAGQEPGTRTCTVVGPDGTAVTFVVLHGLASSVGGGFVEHYGVNGAVVLDGITAICDDEGTWSVWVTESTAVTFGAATTEALDLAALALPAVVEAIRTPLET